MSKRNILVLVLSLVVVFSAFAESDWMLDEDEDIMSGDVRYFLIGDAEATQGTIGRPALLVRHQDDTEVFIVWGGYNLSRDLSRITMVFGDEDAESVSVSLSEDRGATFFRDPEGLLARLNDLPSDSRFIARTQTATGPTMIIRWTLTEFHEPFEELVTNAGLDF